jgi:hypothetical protein
MVSYSGRPPGQPVYRCERPNQMLGLPRCFTFGGLRVDTAVARELLRAFEPMAVEAGVEADRRYMGARWVIWSRTLFLDCNRLRRPSGFRRTRRGSRRCAVPGRGASGGLHDGLARAIRTGDVQPRIRDDARSSVLLPVRTAAPSVLKQQRLSLITARKAFVRMVEILITCRPEDQTREVRPPGC